MVGLSVSRNVSSAPASTTNITGFRTIARGSSLSTASQRAGTRIAALNVVPRDDSDDIVAVVIADSSSERLAGDHLQLLCDRPDRSHREEGEQNDDDDGAREDTRE